MIIDTFQDWYCPNCGVTDRTRGIKPNRFHHCAKLGLTAPLLLSGTPAKVEIRLREDYIGNERAGRVMSVVTIRDNGQDVIAFAPAATGESK